MLKQMGQVIALSWSLTAVVTTSAGAATFTLTLDIAEIGSHLSEGTRVPSSTFGGAAQYNRTEVFVGYGDDPTLLSLRTVFGFDLEPLRTALPSGARIDSVTLQFRATDISGNQSGSQGILGLELWESPEQFVESEVDFDVYSTGNPWSPAFAAGSSSGLGTLLSSDPTTLADTSQTIALSDTTGNFVSTLNTAVNTPGAVYNLILTSLASEATAQDAVLRIVSDDGASSLRPTLTIDYTPIQQITAAQFNSNFTLLDFEGSTPGYLDAAADNPSTNTLFTSNGITSVSAAAATNQSDEQNQNTINDKGLYYVGGTAAFVDGDEGRFAILHDDSFDGLSELSEFRMDGGPTWTIDFESVQDQFGVTFIDQTAQTMTFTFFLDGVEQGAFNLSVALTTTAAGNELYAMQTPFVFDRVVISGTDTTDGWGLGEIRFALIPEPTAFVTCALGALALLRRRHA